MGSTFTLWDGIGLAIGIGAALGGVVAWCIRIEAMMRALGQKEADIGERIFAATGRIEAALTQVVAGLATATAQASAAASSAAMAANAAAAAVALAGRHGAQL